MYNVNTPIDFFFFIFARSSSVVCSAQPSHVSHETIPSLPGLACHGWRDHPGLVSSSSPFPLLTGLGFLLDTIMDIHKGLCCKAGFHALSHTSPVRFLNFTHINMYFAAPSWRLAVLPPACIYLLCLLSVPSSLISCCQNL